MAGGGTTTTVDNNNPYSNQLATNSAAMWKILEPMIVSGMQGQETPMGAQSNLASQQISRYYAGRYGQPTGDSQFNATMDRNTEDLTRPNMDWMKAAGGLYGAGGAPGPGGTTTTSTQNLGTMDYLQLAATLAALVA